MRATVSRVPVLDDYPDRHPALTSSARVILREVFSEDSTATLVGCRDASSWLRRQISVLSLYAKRNALTLGQLLFCVQRAWSSLPHLRTELDEENVDMLGLVLILCAEEYAAIPDNTAA
jgi:hypothetical protein